MPSQPARAEAGQRFFNHAGAIQPVIVAGAGQHRIFAADLIGEGRARRTRPLRGSICRDTACRV